jgi:hypothetical protein
VRKHKRYVRVRVREGILVIDKLLKVWTLFKRHEIVAWGSTKNAKDFEVAIGRRSEWTSKESLD